MTDPLSFLSSLIPTDLSSFPLVPFTTHKEALTNCSPTHPQMYYCPVEHFEDTQHLVNDIITKTASVVNLVPSSWSPLRNHLPQNILRTVTCIVKACILE